MNLKKYELIIYSRYNVSNYDDLLQSYKAIEANPETFRRSGCKIVHADAISITFMKTYLSVSWKGE